MTKLRSETGVLIHIQRYYKCISHSNLLSRPCDGLFVKQLFLALGQLDRMSRTVQSQADVGSLSLAGLGAFSSILATLSADNVVPMALIQMGELGTALPISGEYADSVKSLLQRCSDVRLDHLAMVIGWRKNDSASLMADSAGGQAIALVSMCLLNLFRAGDTGTILGRLCSRLLSSSMNISSMEQLADVAKLLSGKLNTLGFGNLLAREVTKIHQVYEALGKPAPQNLLEPLDTESTIELLESISRVLREDHKICRISGSRGMGHILGLVQALFRRNTMVTVEGTIIQDIEHFNIVCEIIQRDHAEPTQVHLETFMPTSKPIELPITIRPGTSEEPMPYNFKWSGCVADRLQLTFLNYGFNCDQAILDACCDLLVLIPTALSVLPTFSRENERLPPAPLLALLGPLPRARICTICEEILRSKPKTSQMDLSTAYSNLVATASGKFREVICLCPDDYECDWKFGWVTDGETRRRQQKKRCELHQLWDAIGYALSTALWCFFVNPGPNTTICPIEGMGRRFITNALEGQMTLKVDEILEHILRLVGSRGGRKGCVAMSSNSCTIYPTILKNLSVPSHQAVTFTLVEGNFVFEGRYHRRLDARPVRARPKTKKPLRMDTFRPSHNEMQIGSPLLTVREAFDCLEVLCSFKSSGYDTKVNLEAVILGYVGMRWTDTCHHPMTDHVDLDKDRFMATSVASPAAEGRFGVVMTRWNPVAQFLCCELGYQAILVKDCCLDCAAEILRSRRAIGAASVVFILG